MPGIAPCSKNRGLMDIGVHHVTLPHPPKCYSLLAGLRCPRAARHSTAWCKWGALCKWSNIFATSVRGSHTTFLFHPSWLFFFFFFPAALPTATTAWDAHPFNSSKDYRFKSQHKYLKAKSLIPFFISQFHDFHSLSQPPLTQGKEHFSLKVYFQCFLTHPCLSVLYVSFFFCFNSSPNFTSWPCSRAPSPLHTATRASRVGVLPVRRNLIAVCFC